MPGTCQWQSGISPHNMEMHIMKKTMIAGLALATMMVAGCATDPVAMTPRAAGMDFVAWDTNRDGMLDQNEFRGQFQNAGVWNDWDTNRDGWLNTTEFNRVSTALRVQPAMYTTWDMDRNGMLTSTELYMGSFNMLDTDRNRMITRTEFNPTVAWGW